jgi:hypothetical protein
MQFQDGNQHLSLVVEAAVDVVPYYRTVCIITKETTVPEVYIFSMNRKNGEKNYTY